VLHDLQTIGLVAPSTGRFGDSSATPGKRDKSYATHISLENVEEVPSLSSGGGKGVAVLLDTACLFSKFLGSKRLLQILRRLDGVDEKDLLAQIGRIASDVADLWQRASDRETLSGINSRMRRVETDPPLTR